MTPSDDIRWTIAELGREVERALSVGGYEGVANKQVRSIPDTRTIRYYTTLGLLDRPVETRGRTHLYGRRHLEQLVAIKRLQARGHSLAEIQGLLAGISNRKLADIAALPDDAPAAPKPAKRRRSASVEAERGGGFWRDVPDREVVVTLSAPPPAAPPPPVRADSPPVLTSRLELAPGVELAITGALTGADAAAIRDSAAPLLERLHYLGLLAPRS